MGLNTTSARKSFLMLLCLYIFGNCVHGQISFLREAKCLIPNGIDHLARALLFQQCISQKYGQGNETICYDQLGCFPMEEPWITLLRPFPTPLPPEDIDTTITLYTRNTLNGTKVQLWPMINLQGLDFKRMRPITVFMTHGFASNGTADWLLEIKDNYLEQADVNVFVVGWGPGASLLNYLQVASNTRIVGAELVRFGKFLIKNGLETDKMHLIGHSLGAHIMSYMAKGLQSPKPVRRLTALDPAQPGFEGASKEVRLNKGDAQFIDAIHTDAKPFIPLMGFGMMQPAGDVDFYMNGGMSQPGCLTVELPKMSSISDLASMPVEVVSQWVSCSHGRSHAYFNWALKLKNCSLWGRKMSTVENFLKITSLGTLAALDPLIKDLDDCDENTCSVIGLQTFRLKARGAFAVTTGSFKPYCDTPERLSKKLGSLFGGLYDVVTGSLGKLPSLF